MTEQLFAKLLDAGLVLVVMGVAIWWLQDTLRKFINKLDEERAHRFAQMDQEIERQRKANEECEEDRERLHAQFADLFKKNPGLHP